MTRHEVEKEISNKFFDILKLYKEYEPEGEYLNLSFVDGNISCNNDYWGEINRIDFCLFKDDNYTEFFRRDEEVIK